MRSTLTLSLLLVGCDDTIFGKAGEGGGGGTDYADGYEGVVEIMADNCTSCHPSGGGSAGLDLESDLCGTTVDVTAQNYDGTLVVAGDASTSVLWAKMADNGEFGGVMPPSGGLDASVVEIVAAWIDDGASCDG